VIPDLEPREQIARLEAKIEALNVSAEWCRKIALASRAAIAAGLLLLAALIFGFVRIDALTLMLTAILSLGGIVLFGSNDTTAKQTAEQIAAAEAERAELIGEMELTLVPQVGEPSRLLH
jgi:hypothetical protein